MWTRRNLIILSLFLLIILTSVTLLFIQHQQTTQQHASGLSSTCENTPTDTVLVIDTSGSMAQDNKLTSAQSAAQTFIDQLSSDTRNKVALVTFASNVKVLSQLTNNFSQVKSQVSTLQASGDTCLQCGIRAANTVFSKAGDNQKKVVVLLTDGLPNLGYFTFDPLNLTFPVPMSSTQAASAATTELQTDYAQNHAAYYTIGLGPDVNTSLLTNMANFTSGEYNFSPTADQLAGIYDKIFTIIGKGSIAGMTYTVPGPVVQGLSGVAVNITDNTTGGSEIATSDASTGTYMFSGLCDASYTVSATAPDGMQQILPAANAPTYSITINGSNVVTDKNFEFASSRLSPSPTVSLSTSPTPMICGGLKVNSQTCPSGYICSYPSNRPPDVGGICVPGSPSPTATLTPTVTIVPCKGANITCPVQPNCSYVNPGYCTCGQLICGTPAVSPSLTQAPTATLTPTPSLSPNNVNLVVNATLPGIGTSAGDNQNPLHPTRSGSIAVYDVNNHQLFHNSITFVYNQGMYTGSVPTNLSPGVYSIKIRLDNTLWRSIPGVQTLKLGDNNLSAVTLVPGDLNNNNILDISDYQVFISCYGDKQCSEKTLADFDDDGTVDLVDYNILLRSFAVHNGD